MTTRIRPATQNNRRRRCRRRTRSCRCPAMPCVSGRADDTTRSSVCTLVLGLTARRRTVRSTTSMPMSACSAMARSAAQPVCHLACHASMFKFLNCLPDYFILEFKELRKQWRQQKKRDSVGASPAARPANAGGATNALDGSPGGGELMTTTATMTRRRRATDSALSLSMPGDMTVTIDHEDGVSSHSASHRLSLGDLHYSPSDDEANALGPSPTSTASDSVAYWQESPISPPVDLAQQQQQQARAPTSGLHRYPVAMTSPPLSPDEVRGLSPPMSRLPPNSTLLTPLPGYRPPSPVQMPARMGEAGGGNGSGGGGSLMHQHQHISQQHQLSQHQQHQHQQQSLHASGMGATLSPGGRSPKNQRGYDDYQSA